MQNSAVVSRLPLKGSGKDVVTKTLASKLQKTVANTAQSGKPPVKWQPIRKQVQPTLVNKNNNELNNRSNNNKDNSARRLTTIPTKTTKTTTTLGPMSVNCLERGTSATSLTPRRTEGESEAMPKSTNRFIKPRLNQLTQQRIFRLRQAHTDADNAGHVSVPSTQGAKDCKSPSLTSVSVCPDLELGGCVTGSNPCPQPLLKLQKQLEDMQSEFMQKVSTFREKGFGYAYKLVTIMHNDTCQVLLPKDDLIGLPTNLPVQSVNDLKHLCHNVFKEGFTFIFEQIASVQMAKDEATAAAQREDLRIKLKNELSKKLVAVDHELTQLCSVAGKGDSAGLMRQVCDLNEVNNQLKCTNAQLDAGLADVRKSRDELRRLLESSQERCNELALEMADVNISVVEQANALDDLQVDLKQMKKTNRILNQRLDENDRKMESSRMTISQYVEHVEDLTAQLQKAQADRLFLTKRTDELNLIIADRDHLIAEQKRQLTALKQDKDCQPETTSNELALQAEQERMKSQLANHVQVEKTLREELELKQEALRKAELKTTRLEEQIEHHRQVLTVRGERINSLDQEMKQREQESNRKINDIMAQTSDKNSLITQITNELASTNEQFQNLCATLSVKQTKLHSQEHVIKLLEESNARSVKLHTKLGEKNALLKDELDHLRRTVNNLMVGSDISDVDVADILLE